MCGGTGVQGGGGFLSLDRGVGFTSCPRIFTNLFHEAISSRCHGRAFSRCPNAWSWKKRMHDHPIVENNARWPNARKKWPEKMPDVFWKISFLGIYTKKNSNARILHFKNTPKNIRILFFKNTPKKGFEFYHWKWISTKKRFEIHEHRILFFLAYFKKLEFEFNVG